MFFSSRQSLIQHLERFVRNATIIVVHSLKDVLKLSDKQTLFVFFSFVLKRLLRNSLLREIRPEIRNLQDVKECRGSSRGIEKKDGMAKKTLQSWTVIVSPFPSEGHFPNGCEEQLKTPSLRVHDVEYG